MYYEQGIIQALRAARGAEALRPGSSDIVSTGVQLAIVAVLAVILLARRRDYAPVLRHMLPYAAIVLLCFASAAWSGNPATTLRRSVSLASCVLFGLYLRQTFGLGGAIDQAGRAAVALGALSILVFVAAPRIGRETALGYENAMRGVFSQKNPMAECMLLGVTCVCHRALADGLRPSRIAALLLLLLCIALGRSATSLAIALLVIGAALAMASGGRGRLLLGFGAGWAALATATMLAVAPEAVWGLLGRDASLTGRAPLWRQVLRVIAERPLLGHGYAGFWSDDSPQVQYIWLLAGWRAPDSHNGYLDTVLQLGVAGLGAYLFLWGRVLSRAVQAARRGGLQECRWVLLFMLANLVLNLDEGPMPFADGFTLMMPAALAALGAWHERRQAQPRWAMA